VSYWTCYHRRKYPAFGSYPGSELLEAFRAVLVDVSLGGERALRASLGGLLPALYVEALRGKCGLALMRGSARDADHWGINDFAEETAEMDANHAWTRPEAVAVAGLLTSAAGIGVLWAVGLDFPFYPPPGMLIMTSGALAFTLMRSRLRFAALVPALLGLSGIVGFVMESVVGGGIGLANLTGGAGTGAVVGQGLQQLGVIVASVAGAKAVKGRASRTPHAA
jgi:hypothetical protein